MAARGPGWVVFGAGGHARAVVDVIERSGGRVVAVSGVAAPGSWHVECLEDDLQALERVHADSLRAVVAIGANPARLNLVRAIAADGVRVPTVIAVTATVSLRSRLGEGTVVLEHAHVGPATTVGAGVIVNTGAVVEHDCTVGDGSHVAPGACVLGGVTIGARTFVGSGARILPGIVVGAGVTVGAGAVVTTDVPDGRTVVGVPARGQTTDRTTQHPTDRATQQTVQTRGASR